jgi:hypothetical protein
VHKATGDKNEPEVNKLFRSRAAMNSFDEMQEGCHSDTERNLYGKSNN